MKKETVRPIFNWFAQDINNIAPITIPRLLKYPFTQMQLHSAGYPTGAGDSFTDEFCLGARLAERAVTLGNIVTAVAIGTVVTGGLGLVAGIGVYGLGAIFGNAAGRKVQNYLKPETPAQAEVRKAAAAAAQTKKATENDWMSPAGKAQYEAARKNEKFPKLKSLKRSLLRLVRR